MHLCFRCLALWCTNAPCSYTRNVFNGLMPWRNDCLLSATMIYCDDIQFICRTIFFFGREQKPHHSRWMMCEHLWCEEKFLTSPTSCSTYFAAQAHNRFIQIFCFIHYCGHREIIRSLCMRNYCCVKSLFSMWVQSHRALPLNTKKKKKENYFRIESTSARKKKHVVGKFVFCAYFPPLFHLRPAAEEKP